MQNRRSFLKNIALGAAAVYSRKTFSIPKFQMGLTGKNMNDNINIALIGKGGMGTADTRTALSVEGVKLVAVCDLYDRRLDEAVKQWGNDLFLTKDYKEILALKNCGCRYYRYSRSLASTNSSRGYGSGQTCILRKTCNP